MRVRESRIDGLPRARLAGAFALLLLCAAAPPERRARRVDPAPAPAPAVPAVAATPVTGDPATGEALVAACAGCHGPEGRSENPQWPQLAGQRATYIVKQLEDFRAERRADPQMSPMAATLQAEDLPHVAAYFSTRTPRTTHVAPSDAGRLVYTKGRPLDRLAPCVGCHGSRGQGVAGVFPGGVPVLAGQSADYVTKQLLDFRQDARNNDGMGVMRAVAKKLTDDEIRAVAAYVEGLR